jgi:hypothetical protein
MLVRRTELRWNRDAASTPQAQHRQQPAAGRLMTRGSYAFAEDETLLREQNFCSGIHNGVIPHPTGAQARSYSD